MGRKPVTKDRKNDEQTRNGWIEKLSPIYLQNGLKSFSMEDVSKLLGVSKATLYKHFHSREEIISLALQGKLESIGLFKKQLLNEELSYVERYTEAMKTFMNEAGGISTLFLSDLQSLYPEIWRQVNYFIDYVISILTDFYARGIEQNIFRPIHPAILSLSDRLMFTALSDASFLTAHQLTLSEAFMQYFEIRLHGVFLTQHE